MADGFAKERGDSFCSKLGAFLSHVNEAKLLSLHTTVRQNALNGCWVLPEKINTPPQRNFCHLEGKGEVCMFDNSKTYYNV